MEPRGPFSQNFPTPRVVIEHKDRPNFFLKNGFPMKGDGYPMGTHRVSHKEKNHHGAFRKMECICMQTFCVRVLSPKKKRYDDFGMEIQNILNTNSIRFVGISKEHKEGYNGYYF
jgi:hypothetical protein